MKDSSGITKPNPELQNVAGTHQAILPNGDEYTFPCLDDYVKLLIDQQIIASKSDLLENPTNEQVIGAIMMDWSNQAHSGCLFATKLARNMLGDKRLEARWETAFLRLSTSVTDFSIALETILRTACESDMEAMQLVFPDVFSPEDVVNLINRLCTCRGWYWIDVPWERNEPTAQLVGLRWQLPTNNTVVNQTLGFAPLTTMPLTRRSPFTSIVLRVSDRIRKPPVGVEDSSDRVLENGRVAIHLADMESNITSDEINATYWVQTKKMKAIRLGEKPDAARAKVTFSLPFDAAAGLNDSRPVEYQPIEFDEAQRIINEREEKGS